MKYATIEALYMPGATEDSGFYRVTIKKTSALIDHLNAMTVANSEKVNCDFDNNKTRPLLIRDVARLVKGSSAELLFCEGEEFYIDCYDMTRAENNMISMRDAIEKLLRTNVRLHALMSMKEIKSNED